MPEPIRVTVLIPVYQGARTLGACLAAVRAQDYPADRIEVLVVNDGSTDGSEAIARSVAGVQIVSLPHLGRPGALNRGLARAGGDVVLFTDADCEPPPDWASTLVGILRDDPRLAGVGGNMLPRVMTAVETAKVLPYLHEFARDRVLEGTYAGSCLNGNNMAIRREALLEVGGFGEGYLHGADADLTRRLLARGYRLLRTRRSLVTHLKRESLVDHLRTRFTRGSTIRFAMEEGIVWRRQLFRAFLRVKAEFLIDFARLRGLAVLERPVPPRSRVLAPWINLLGGWANWAGQVHYYRRFRPELQRLGPKR